MKRAEKEQWVTKLRERFRAAPSVILAEYRGLKVSEINELRRDLRQNEAEFKVLKNRLAKKALAGLPQEGLAEHFRGPTAVAIGGSDPTLFKVLTRHAENFPALKIKAGFLEGRLLDIRAIETLSKLPSKEELLAKALGCLAAPATNVARALQEISSKLVRTLKAISEKSGTGG